MSGVYAPRCACGSMRSADGNVRHDQPRICENLERPITVGKPRLDRGRRVRAIRALLARSKGDLGAGAERRAIGAVRARPHRGTIDYDWPDLSRILPLRRDRKRLVSAVTMALLTRVKQ